MMEWVLIAFGNAKYKMAANMASKMAAVITKISKTTEFSTVFASRSALLGPRLFDHHLHYSKYIPRLTLEHRCA